MVWKILMCYDGSPAAAGAEAMMAALRLTQGGSIDVLGVVESERGRAALESAVTAMVARLGERGASARPLLRRGHAAEEILRQAETGDYEMVATGAHGHGGLTRVLLGSTSSRLARHLSTSLLICRRPPSRVDQVLICSAGESPSLATLQTGGRVAAQASAEVTVLHVMSQVALSWESPSVDLLDAAEGAMSRGSPEGLHLRQALEMLQGVGLKSDPKPLLRHGLVVDEVVAQIRESDAQLLVIGAHRPPEPGGAFSHLLDDIADQLLRHAPCSVLVVRGASPPS